MQMQDLMSAIVARAPKGHAFVLLAIPFGDSPDRPAQWITNSNPVDARQLVLDMAKAFKAEGN